MTSFFYDLPYIRQTLGIDFDGAGASLCCDKAAPGQDGKTPRNTPNYRTAADCIWTMEMLRRYLWMPHNSSGTPTTGATPFHVANGARTKKGSNGQSKGCYISSLYDLPQAAQASYTNSQGNTFIPPNNVGTVGARQFSCLYFSSAYSPIQSGNFETLVRREFTENSGFFYSGIMVACPASTAGIWSYAGLAGIQNSLKGALAAYCWAWLGTEVVAIDVYYHFESPNSSYTTGPVALEDAGDMEAYEEVDTDGNAVQKYWHTFKLKIVPPTGYALYYQNLVDATLAGGAAQSPGTGLNSSFALNANLETAVIDMRDYLPRRWNTISAGREKSARWNVSHVLSFTRPQDWLDLITQQ